MDRSISRKQFLQAGPAAALGVSAAVLGSRRALARADRTINLGIAGAGNRGRGLMMNIAGVPGVSIKAINDIDPAALRQARELLAGAGHPRPEEYGRGEQDYRRMMDREDLDAVIIASPWHWHTPMAVYAMRAGKYAGVEVPCALTLEECWQLVDTSEQTGVPCMMLENWSFRRDNLAVLKMIRAGLLGDTVHCHCAHSHDCIDHWFFDPEGEIRWGGDYLVKRNADQYPTHSLGPVLSWMDLGCGDYFDYLTSTATSSRGINHYFAAKFGPDHPNAKRRYAQGDIVTSVVKTLQGKSIVINYDMQLPRPYDNRWMIQGLNGLYDEDRQVVYLHGRSPAYHEWEPFAPYQRQFDHQWYKELEADAAGHGGTDYLELKLFAEAVRDQRPTPLDVYDSVLMSVIAPLSAQSIAGGSIPVKCPDFTRGKWRTNKPYFALEA